MKLPIINAVLLNLLAHSVNGVENLADYTYIGKGWTYKDLPSPTDTWKDGLSLTECKNNCENAYGGRLVAIIYLFKGGHCECNVGTEGNYYDLALRKKEGKDSIWVVGTSYDWVTYQRDLTIQPTNLPSKKPTKVPTRKPTNLPSKKPTKVPTKEPTAMPAGAQGDPHFITWSNKKFDFHGVCDLLMVSNENFENSLGMEIHIRTKKMHMWSYISVLAIRIGNSILEVIGEDGGSYIMNGIVHQGKDDGLMMFSGYPIIYSKKNKKQQTFRLNLGNLEAIVIKTWNSFVSVHFENPKSKHFEDSTGLMGSFPDGVLLARDNLTIIDDANRFGQEWQVMETEKTLFHQVQGPQQPLKKCEIPSNLDMRRRLGEKTITEEKAKTACIGVEANSIDLCIFDVMATCNLSTAGAY